MKTETYVCQACGVEVIRPVARGQRPKWCPSCRASGYRSRRTCHACGSEFVGAESGSYCSVLCKTFDQYGPRVSKLPKSHAVMVAQRPKPEPRVRKQPDYSWRTSRECPGCGCTFSPLHTPTAVCCSLRCSRRVARRRRRAREHNTLNAWRWSDFMRIARKFNFQCAYCGECPGRLEPDHVVPLSRGGADAVSNLLPACRLCNCDKRDLPLAEWGQDRARRGLEPRTTSWSVTDARFTHLTVLPRVA